MNYKIFIFAISATLSWIAYYFLIPQFKKLLLDIPNNRSLHVNPTPKGGGLIFVIFTTTFSILSLIFNLGQNFEIICLLTIPLSIIGFLDDRYNISPFIRYGIQLLTAILIFSYKSETLLLNDVKLNFIPYLIIVIGITAMINFINFMDGIDGLVGFSLLIILVFIGIISSFNLALCVLIGSLLSFNIWNWSPAKIFMGDVGSTFLGAIYCGLILQMETWTQSFNVLIFSSPLILDSLICIFIRFRNGQNIFKAHKLHLYQRLFEKGWDKRVIVLCYIIPTILLCSSYLWFGTLGEMIILILTIVFGLTLNKSAKPFLK